MKIGWGYIILLIALVGCKHYNLPRGFPDVDKMANILVEIQIAESTIAQLPGQSAVARSKSQGYYKFILDKYGYTTTEFDSIRKWYAHHPELYVKVYDKMLVSLSKEEARIRARSDKEKALEREEAKKLAAERELRNLWKDSTSIYVLPTDSFDKRLPFLIEVDTLELKGMVEFSAFYKFMKEDVSEQPKVVLTALYPDSLIDSVSRPIPHSFNEKFVTLLLALRDSISPSQLEGYLLYQDSVIQSDVQIRDIYLENVVDSVKENKPGEQLQLMENK